MTEKKEEKNRETIFPFGMETKKIKKSWETTGAKKGSKTIWSKTRFWSFCGAGPYRNPKSSIDICSASSVANPIWSQGCSCGWRHQLKQSVYYRKFQLLRRRLVRKEWKFLEIFTSVQKEGAGGEGNVALS